MRVPRLLRSALDRPGGRPIGGHHLRRNVHAELTGHCQQRESIRRVHGRGRRRCRPPGVNYPDTEIEPFVAVNPMNPQHPRRLPAGSLGDGGAKGSSRLAPRQRGLPGHGTTPIQRLLGQGGDPVHAARAHGPWVSFDSAGARLPDRPQHRDGGRWLRRRWSSHPRPTAGPPGSQPVDPITDDDPVEFLDKQSITAEGARRAGKA